MQAVILLAGYGSRLKRDDLAHKCLLPVGEETLLSRHLKILQDTGIETAVLVLGHNKEAIKDYVRGLNLTLRIDFVDNDLYLTTGNTLSLVMGLRKTDESVLILDGDVLYPRELFQKFVRTARPSVFATVPVDVNNEECTKVLLNRDGSIRAFITKRLLTAQEKETYDFGGEAIGFFILTVEHAKQFVDLYDANESRFVETLWEIPFSEFAADAQIHPWATDDPGCFEIDTAEDYAEAMDYFSRHRGRY